MKQGRPQPPGIGFYFASLRFVSSKRIKRYSGCISLILSLQSFSQQRVNRDNEWVWLGREALAERQHEGSLPKRLSASVTVDASNALHDHQTRGHSKLIQPMTAHNTANFVATKPDQRLSLAGSFHSGSPRVQTAKRSRKSTCATCHYEVSENAHEFAFTYCLIGFLYVKKR